MNKRLILMFFVLFFSYLNLVFAQCGTTESPCDENWDDFDYKNNEADISQIPPDKVKIDEVIKSGRAQELKSNQIQEHLSEIDDLTILEEKEAQKAIENEFGVQNIKLGNGARIDSQGILHATYGKKDYINLDHVSKDSIVEIDKEGNILLIGEKKPPKKGSYTILNNEPSTIELNGKETVFSGELSFKDGQPYLKAGNEIVIRDFKILESKNDVYVYLDAPFDPKDHVNENYFYLSENEFAMHSTKDGEVKIEPLAGNNFFDMNKRKYERDENGKLVRFKQEDKGKGYFEDRNGFKYKIEADNKDLLRLAVSGGDSLEGKKRTESEGFLFFGEDRKLIPNLVHNRNQDNGKTIIDNGRNTVYLDDEFNYDTLKFTSQEEFIRINHGRFQSVAFQLESNSLSDSKEMRFGSNNQFAFVGSDDGNAKVVFNRYRIGISKYSDEQIQSIDELEAKWSNTNMKFGLADKQADVDQFGRPLKSEEYNQPSPYMVQAVNQWLEENPDNNVKEISFSDIGNAYFPVESATAENKVRREFKYKENTYVVYDAGVRLVLGEQIFDPETNEVLFTEQFHQDRTIVSDPLSIVTHEYTHGQDKVTRVFEEYILSRVVSNSNEIDKVIESRIDKNNLGEIHPNEFGVYEPLESAKETQKEYETKYKASEALLEEVGYDNFAEEFTKRKIDPAYSSDDFATKEKIDYYINSNKEEYEKSSLKVKIIQQYNTEYNQNLQSMDEKSAEKEAVNSLVKNPEYSDYIKDKVYVNRYISEKNNVLVNDIIKENDDLKPLDVHYSEIVEEREKEVFKDPNFKEGLDKAFETLKVEKDEFEDSKYKESAEKYIRAYEAGVVDDYEGLKIYGTLFADKNENLKESYDDNIVKNLQDNSGLPALYAFDSKVEDEEVISGYSFTYYDEVSTTYREESIQERREKIHEGTDAQKEVYKKLTQLSFDSGKMNHEEYKQLMGEDYCKKEDCCDRKCEIYKLICTGSC